MKSLYLLLFASISSYCQIVSPPVLYPRASDPSGSCSVTFGYYVASDNPPTIWGCGGGTWKLVSSGGSSPSTNFSTPVTAPQINGYFTVDGNTYTTLNSAFTAAAANPNGAAIWLGPGNWAITSQLAEPEQSTGVTIIGSGSTNTFITAVSAMTSMLLKANTVQGNFTIRGVTFLCNSGSTINSQYGLQLQWFRGGLLDDVQVQNCGTENITTGNTTSGNQTSLTARDIQTNYNEAYFTFPATGSGLTPPDIGIHLLNNSYDSHWDNVLVRNAHLVGMKIDSIASGNSFKSLHAFGYASTGSLPYSQSYAFEDASGGNEFEDLYCDGNTVSCFHLSMLGTGANDTITSGKFFWPSGTSWPASANFGTLDQAYSDITIGKFYCSGLATNNLWTVSSSPSSVLNGLRNNIADIIGCNSQTIQYDIGDSTNSRFRDLWLRRNIRGSGYAQMAAYNTTSLCSSSASPAACGSSAAGSIAIPIGTNSSLVVSTTATTANSQILLQVDQTLGTVLGVTCNTSSVIAPYVGARTAGVNFKIFVNGTLSTNPECVSYLIIN